jgi:hypothetical protein
MSLPLHSKTVRRLSYSEFKRLCQTEKVIDTTTNLRADASKLLIGGKDVFESLAIQVGGDNSKDGYDIDEGTFSEIIQETGYKVIGIYSGAHSLYGKSVTFSVDSW